MPLQFEVKGTRLSADFPGMRSASQILVRIADLEEEEKLLYRADKYFWENPEHTPEAQAAYSMRRERILRIRRELGELHRDRAIAARANRR